VSQRAGNVYETDANAYARILLTRGHGYPLWVPEPPTNIDGYAVEGARIGDVGVINYDGSFKFLFNIFLPRSHAINVLAPPSLEHIELRAVDSTTKPNIHLPGTIMASDSIACETFDSEPQGDQQVFKLSHYSSF
jgi:hypothetical protein